MVSGAQMVGLQRARLLAAAVLAVEELGYPGATVSSITSRARVSRRTFYELFENREACLLAALEHTVEQVVAELDAAQLDDLAWCERVRTGLWTILCFFDREPALARICVVQSARGSQRVLVYREQILARLASEVDAGRAASPRRQECPPLTAQALVGACLSLINSRLLAGGGAPLGDLLGELMGLIVLPYLGPAVARRERARPAPEASHRPSQRQSALAGGDWDPVQDVPMRLTYRTARVLECVAAQPGVSNRTVADHAGIADQGQVSKLLARLERLGLMSNSGDGYLRGEPNAWTLTALGEQVTRRLSVGIQGVKASV